VGHLFRQLECRRKDRLPLAEAIVDEPLADGSSVVTLSSGAALRGSPLSGGYAGAKAMVRFLTEYVAHDVARSKLGIRFATLLPTISPEGGVGRQATEAYARRQGRTIEQFVGGPALTPADVGAAVLRLLLDRSLAAQIAFSLDRSGLMPLKQGA
jgi:NAD(P)-dependent dehydrogenase (short-subunit alcohol dehydrogenase family)